MPPNKYSNMPTRLTEQRAPRGSGNGGFGQTMRKAKRDSQETTGLCTPTMPADEMRAARSTSDGIGGMAKGMAGHTRQKMMSESQPLPPSKRERGDRPG